LRPKQNASVTYNANGITWRVWTPIKNTDPQERTIKVSTVIQLQREVTLQNGTKEFQNFGSPEVTPTISIGYNATGRTKEGGNVPFPVGRYRYKITVTAVAIWGIDEELTSGPTVKEHVYTPFTVKL